MCEKVYIEIYMSMQLIYLHVCFQKLTVPSAQSFKLFEVTFDDFQLSDDETLKACLRMFLELDLIEKFHINYEVSYKSTVKLVPLYKMTLIAILIFWEYF